MVIAIETRDKYFIKGKIIEADNDTLVVCVTQPFSCQIKFMCYPAHYNYIHSSRLSKYNWLGLDRGSHPESLGASAYYNAEQKTFYKRESDSESEWEISDFEDIYRDNSHFRTNDLYSYQKEHKFFVDRYIPILQEGQSCTFYAYALQETNEKGYQSVYNSQVKRHPDDPEYRWIYDPDTFYVGKWGPESIDDLVKETLPSRECLEKLLKRHDAADDE